MLNKYRRYLLFFVPILLIFVLIVLVNFFSKKNSPSSKQASPTQAATDKIVAPTSLPSTVSVTSSVSQSLTAEVLGVTANPATTVDANAVTDEAYTQEITLWSLINTWREAHDLDEFFIDEQLCLYAEERLSQIDASLSHAGFFPLSAKIQQQTKFTQLAENLASGVMVGQEDQVLAAWLQSSAHLKNLSSNFPYACLKCQRGYCVQLFANY